MKNFSQEDLKEHDKILSEFNALIKAADRKDPALARNLEWLRDSYNELWDELKFIHVTS